MSPGPIRFGHQATVSSADGPGSRLDFFCAIAFYTLLCRRCYKGKRLVTSSFAVPRVKTRTEACSCCCSSSILVLVRPHLFCQCSHPLLVNVATSLFLFVLVAMANRLLSGLRSQASCTAGSWFYSRSSHLWKVLSILALLFTLQDLAKFSVGGNASFWKVGNRCVLSVVYCYCVLWGS